MNLSVESTPIHAEARAEKGATLLWWVLWLLPIIGIAALVWRWAVDVPFWDEWAVSYVLTAAKARGYPLFSELFAQHTESREVIPRFIFFCNAELTHWNLRVQMMFNVGVMALGAVGLTILIRRRFKSPAVGILVAAAANALFLSPSQWENWLWGLQLAAMSPVVYLIWALVVLDRRGGFWVRCIFAAILALSATYSFANGMSLWVLLFPSLMLCAGNNIPRRIGAGIFWVLLAGASIGAYFYNYQKPPDHPSLMVALRHPVESAEFVMILVGNGLRMTSQIPSLMRVGFVACLGTLALCIGVVRERIIAQSMPWLTLIAYTAVSCLITTAGRMGFGMFQATASRYASFALPLYIAGMMLAVILFRQWLPASVGSRRDVAHLVVGSLLTLCVMAIGFSWSHGTSELKSWSQTRMPGRVCIQFYYSVPEPDVITQRIFPRPDLLPERVRAVAQAGLLSCGLIESNEVAPLNGGGIPEVNGAFDGLTVDGPTVRVWGWAAIREGKRPADAVLLSAPDAAGVQRFFAIADSDRESRPDVAAAMKIPALAHSGWSKSFPTSRLPRGKAISAWAYDSYAKKAYRLSATHQAP